MPPKERPTRAVSLTALVMQATTLRDFVVSHAEEAGDEECAGKAPRDASSRGRDIANASAAMLMMSLLPLASDIDLALLQKEQLVGYALDGTAFNLFDRTAPHRAASVRIRGRKSREDARMIDMTFDVLPDDASLISLPDVARFHSTVMAHVCPRWFELPSVFVGFKKTLELDSIDKQHLSNKFNDIMKVRMARTAVPGNWITSKGIACSLEQSKKVLLGKRVMSPLSVMNAHKHRVQVEDVDMPIAHVDVEMGDLEDARKRVNLYAQYHAHNQRDLNDVAIAAAVDFGNQAVESGTFSGLVAALPTLEFSPKYVFRDRLPPSVLALLGAEDAAQIGVNAIPDLLHVRLWADPVRFNSYMIGMMPNPAPAQAPAAASDDDCDIAKEIRDEFGRPEGPSKKYYVTVPKERLLEMRALPAVLTDYLRAKLRNAPADLIEMVYAGEHRGILLGKDGTRWRVQLDDWKFMPMIVAVGGKHIARWLTERTDESWAERLGTHEANVTAAIEMLGEADATEASGDDDYVADATEASGDDDDEADATEAKQASRKRRAGDDADATESEGTSGKRRATH